ncbi:MAG: hypothetical protein HYZ00_11140 [Candidatus Hydrogenedentes bacterium]|nr:hypothetical protein [Candidatus Hydrogenedentota bacterium]
MDSGYRRLRAAWIEWEQMRLVFNAVMIAQGLIWLYVLRECAHNAGHDWCSSLHGYKLFYSVFGDFIIANFVYCGGPLLETYVVLIAGAGMAWGRRALVLALLLGSSWLVWDLGFEALRHIDTYY